MSSETKNDQPEQPSGNVTGSEQATESAASVPRSIWPPRPCDWQRSNCKRRKNIYDDICRQAAEKIQSVRETTIGEVIDDTLETVKKHPGPSPAAQRRLGFLPGPLVSKAFQKMMNAEG